MTLKDESFKGGDSVMTQSHDHSLHDVITFENLITDEAILESSVHRH